DMAVSMSEREPDRMGRRVGLWSRFMHRHRGRADVVWTYGGRSRRVRTNRLFHGFGIVDRRLVQLRLRGVSRVPPRAPMAESHNRPVITARSVITDPTFPKSVATAQRLSPEG